MMDLTLLTPIATGVIGYMGKMAAQKHQDQIDLMKMHIETTKAESGLQDAANVRGSHLGRRVVAFSIVFTFIIGLLIVAFFPSIDVSMVIAKPAKSFLGLFDYGGGMEVIRASGFVMPEWTPLAVLSVISFYLGTSTAKR